MSTPQWFSSYGSHDRSDNVVNRCEGHPSPPVCVPSRENTRFGGGALSPSPFTGTPPVGPRDAVTAARTARQVEADQDVPAPHAVLLDGARPSSRDVTPDPATSSTSSTACPAPRSTR
ncbi:hypothetical protein GCM10010358_74350 [Streptomyces minutiscleroticus]|uniref:Uncharacterized protein n=1 Tax=Streptomyces minutiscleroticus TaxID=68238 RepID=A0A918P0A6_9ACTN|nr:hypothetical protein GCM10010358_74350 [Streptomyces minutiscleroticus]